jgi:hypothetical protein
VAGVAILGAGAAFAWWAYSKRVKRVQTNRRRSSRRTSRNPIAKPVTVYAVGKDGMVKEVGIARGRAQVVKLVKASVPLADHFEVHGRYDALRDIGLHYAPESKISVPGGWARVRSVELPPLPITPSTARY